MPTPAARATASRLVSAPPSLKTSFAAARTRSRLRAASARGLRSFFPNVLAFFILTALKSGGILRISTKDPLIYNNPLQANSDKAELRPQGGVNAQDGVSAGSGSPHPALPTA